MTHLKITDFNFNFWCFITFFSKNFLKFLRSLQIKITDLSVWIVNLKIWIIDKWQILNLTRKFCSEYKVNYKFFLDYIFVFDRFNIFHNILCEFFKYFYWFFKIILKVQIRFFVPQLWSRSKERQLKSLFNI